MLTFTEWLQTHDNQHIALLAPGNQCFDCVVSWTDNLTIPHAPGNPSPFPYEYAYQIYTGYSTFQKTYFDRIGNGPLNSPQKGDIVVWSSNYNNGAGHTGVATGRGSWFNFDCFEQNDPVGSVSHVRTYSYSYVMGWLRPKAVPLTCDQKLVKIRQEVESGNSDGDVRSHIRTILR